MHGSQGKKLHVRIVRESTLTPFRTVFWKMQEKIFDGSVPDEMNGQMWGLTGVGPPASATAQAAVLAGAQGGGFQGLNGGMMFHPGSARHGDGPSTPTSHPANLASTPGPHGGMMTPSGAFGGYGGK